MSDRFDVLSRRFAQVLDPSQVERLPQGVPELGVEKALLKLKPTSVEQITAILRVANEEDAVLVPTGNGSALHLGNLPPRVDALLSLLGLGGIVDFEPRDLTVVVQAGRTLSDLQKELGRAGQFLAFDPPNHHRATIGGIVATNQTGPLRRMYGSPRDLTLGVRVVLPEGEVVKGGGRVVKNVAGYDTTKLHVGGLGTLGVIVEAAFRLHPLPETYGGVLATFRTWEEVCETADHIVHSELQPLFLEVIHLGDEMWNLGVPRTFAPTLLVGFGGRKETVEYQTKRGRTLASERNAPAHETLDASDITRWHGLIGAVIEAAHRDEKGIVCRVGTTIRGVSVALETLHRLAEAASVSVQCIAHYANGIVISRLCSENTTALVEVVDNLRREMAPWSGSVVVESAPGEVKRRLDVWGPPTSPLAWMRQIRDRFDPRRVLNRGRFLRGLDEEL